MRKSLILVAASLMSSSLVPAQAETTELFTHTFPVAWETLSADVPVTFYTDVDETADTMTVTANGELTSLLPALGKGLELAIDQKDRGCRERWDGRNGASRVENGVLVSQITVHVEKWVCEELFGNEMKTRIAEETGTIIVHLKPHIFGDRLQVEMTDFAANDLELLTQLLGGGQKVKDLVTSELEKVNQDLAQTPLPTELSELGFKLDRVVLREGDTPAGELSITGPHDPIGLLKVIGSLSANGQ